MMLLTNVEGRVGMEPACAVLLEGRGALDAVEIGIRAVEADESVRTVGRGGIPNLLGVVECDAGIMDGVTLEAGAVAALKNHLHAISVARQVMQRLPHVLLAGEGAERFAREIGAAEDSLATDESLERHSRWLEKHVPEAVRASWPPGRLAEQAWIATREDPAGGTVVFLGIDARGRMAAGVSSSGWPHKYPGRVGDSPILGAGLYADGRFGACACTHAGEISMRACTARCVVLYVQQGAPLGEACRMALRDLQALRGGYRGAIVLHAIDAAGNPCILSNRDLGEEMAYYSWSEDAPEIARGSAIVV